MVRQPNANRINQRPPHVLSYHRKMHYLFMGMYALMSLLFIVGCAVWQNYRSIFQSGIIGYFHIVTGLMIGIYLTSNTIEHWVPGEVPANRTQREEQRKRREFFVFKRSASTIIVSTIIGIIMSSLYLYNLGYILIGVCPALALDDATVNPTVVNIEIAYRHKAENEFYSKKNILILRYNTTSQSIIRKTRDLNPNVARYDKWFVQNEVHSIEENVKKDEEPGSFCIQKSDNLLFGFLENEISHFMYKNLNERQEAKAIRIVDKYNMETSDEEEDDMDLHHLTSRICRHEYAFVIIIITFLLLWDVLSISLIVYCAYLIRA